MIRFTIFALTILSVAIFCAIAIPGGANSGASAAPASSGNHGDTPRRPLPVGHPTFVSPHTSPIAISGGQVFVVNTPASTVDVIDTKTRKITARVNVGIDPVGIAVRPDGKEVWVSNHVSDSVSVIDNDSKSPTYLHVVATIQEFDPKTKATRFDEPVGIAFASNEKAYVALSSENQIAVVNVATRKIDKRLTINAQDPRAITVRNGRLYVIPFESNNKTQLSGGAKDKIDGDLVTFDAWDHSIANNNVLSLGHVVDIIKHPKVPDRDLFVFDTATDELVSVVDTLGTLLYGLTVDSKGRVFIAQTDARNDVNGRAGTKKHTLTELQNRAFLNRITRVDVGWDPVPTKTPGRDGAPAYKTEFIELEPLPPQQPAKGQALATPFAIQVTDDDSTLVVSAAGSDKLFTVDAASGAVLGRVAVGVVPRGIALENAESGKASLAWVLNAVADSVSVVDVSDPASPRVVGFVPLADPTPRRIKLGRTWFNDADASTTGTFSCESCHPDGHTDQLLWVIKTPIVTGGNQIMPRSTMPIRGLRDTAPFHWDGIPGDPYGGNNSAKVHGSDAPNSSIDDPASTTRHVIDGGLASTLLLEGDTTVNDEGKAGALTAADRDDMALFLLSVPYPPAQRRAYTNVVSSEATKGFKLFHIDGDLDGKPRPNVCGSCHRMPFLVSTNTPGTGMDAPTWRGAYDRFLILPQGRLNIIDFDFYARVAEVGQPERNIWQFSWGGRKRFDPVWDMVLEGSTGFSGSFARQVTLNKTTVNDELTNDLLAALELSATEGAIVLEAEGVLLGDTKYKHNAHASEPLTLQFDPTFTGGAYLKKTGDRIAITRQELVALASNGQFVGTFTGRHGVKADAEHPQPAIWTLGPIEQQRGRQDFPILHNSNHRMTISGRHIDEDAHLIVDGRRVTGRVRVESGEKLEIELSSLPPVGMHLLQIQNPNGLFSNDFIFHVTENAEAAAELKRHTDQEHADTRDALSGAIARDDLAETKRLLDRNARINERRPQGGSTPLSSAALHGHLEIVKLLIQRGAKVDATNEDGNTPLHVAAFLCRTDVVQLLLEKGASALTKNKRGETPIDVVSSEWNQGLADFYSGIAKGSGFEIDLASIERERPQIAKLLREHAAKPNSNEGK
ncbi:MAG: ankyrin repeat domain-containing protein [Planctomycetota bacterium]|nr:ankyrin repeat domain-containing protein [Planctomycetota bacterium]